MAEHREDRVDPERPGLRRLLGSGAVLLGILFALAGALAADISLEFLGIVLGTAAYALGSRRLGAAAIVVSTVMMILGLLVMRGYVPGIEPTYPGLF
jgi:hypothetical protein